MVFAWIISWGLAIIAGMIYRKRDYQEILDSGWKQPFYPFFPIVGLIGCAYVIYITIAGDYSQFIPMAVWIIALLVFYEVYSKRRITV